METENRFKITFLDIFSITCLSLNCAAFTQVVNVWVALAASSLWMLIFYVAIRQDKVG